MMMMMPMYFTWSTKDLYVLFHAWHVKEDWQYLVSVLVVILAAAAYELLTSFRITLDHKWSYSEDAEPILSKGDANVQRPSPDRSFWSSYYLIRASLHTLQLFLSYMLMLIAMTFNVGLLLALLVGAFVGYFLFGRHKKVKHSSEQLGCHPN